MDKTDEKQKYKFTMRNKLEGGGILATTFAFGAVSLSFLASAQMQLCDKIQKLTEICMNQGYNSAVEATKIAYENGTITGLSSEFGIAAGVFTLGAIGLYKWQDNYVIRLRCQFQSQVPSMTPS